MELCIDARYFIRRILRLSDFIRSMYRFGDGFVLLNEDGNRVTVTSKYQVGVLPRLKRTNVALDKLVRAVITTNSIDE